MMDCRFVTACKEEEQNTSDNWKLRQSQGRVWAELVNNCPMEENPTEFRYHETTKKSCKIIVAIIALHQYVTTSAIADDKTIDTAEKRIALSWPKSSRKTAKEDCKNRLNFSHHWFTAWFDNYEPYGIDNCEQNMPDVDTLRSGHKNQHRDINAHDVVDKVALYISPPIAWADGDYAPFRKKY